MKVISIQKALCAGLLLTSTTTGMYARHLSPDEALSRIDYNQGQKKIAGTPRYDLVYTDVTDSEGYVYVFNIGSNGFVVVSADDRMPAVLGYSNEGSFNPKDTSPSLKWWLSQYAEQAACIFEKTNIVIPAETTRAEDSDADRVAIPAMLKTRWGQDTPYNLECPEMSGQKCVTGCVATAMAQVIKYHGYPAVGNDTHSYQWNGTTLDFKYQDTTFRYEAMPDSYDGSEDEEARNAVAQLMYACGVSVNMNYGPSDSGASDNYMPYALRHYFNYDNGIRLMKRDFFTFDQWEDLIYSELSQKRPVIMGGQAPQGGHQFVCDGYDGNGYFHINWGWKGLGDGHFLLSALNPEIQGIGGFEGGYNSNQTAICGIQPSKGKSDIWYPIYSTGSLSVWSIKNSLATITIDSGHLFNYSPEPVEVEILIQAVAQDGKEYISEPTQFTMGDDPEPRTTYPFPGARGLNIFGFNQFVPFNIPKDLPSGDYRCHLVIRTPEGNIQKIYFPCTCTSYFNLKVTQSGSLSYSQGIPEVKAKVRVTGFEPTAPVIQNEEAAFTLTLENTGDIEYSGLINFKVFQDGKIADNRTYSIALNSIPADATRDYTYTQSFNYKPGTYDFIFYDQYGDQISDAFSISIGVSAVEFLRDEFDAADIYSISGALLRKDADKSAVLELPKGIYILKAQEKTITIMK